MAHITTNINALIDELQYMSSKLADCDPDGDRILEDGLKPFLVSAVIGVLEEMNLYGTGWDMVASENIQNGVE